MAERCAEALGWKRRRRHSSMWLAPGEKSLCSFGAPDYGDETAPGWGYTGPLIAEHGLSIEAVYDKNYNATEWRAIKPSPYRSGSWKSSGWHSTPAAAVAEWVAQYVKPASVAAVATSAPQEGEPARMSTEPAPAANVSVAGKACL